MSVQFGRWNFEGIASEPQYFERISAELATYGPDAEGTYEKGGMTIIYRAFHTTKESRREKQPHISSCGVVVVWDGRLDNRNDLIVELSMVTPGSTDVEIVAAAYERWGPPCFAKLIGDWALAIWNPNNHSLHLAIDPIGTRHLYYSLNSKYLTWSTILAPLVLHSGETFSVCEEYIAGWLSHFPATHLTPYVGIQAVPPSSAVLLQPARRGVKQSVTKYWDFDPDKKLRYKTDADYEEQFRSVFATAVQRRLRSEFPVLAELSGGMDSSSIVCMADTVIGRGGGDTPSLDTITWYDDSNPDWGERPYVTRIEQMRGKAGFHIDYGLLKQADLSGDESLSSFFEGDHFSAIPLPTYVHSELFRLYATYMTSEGYRVTLSGIGGEEITCGFVPTPNPELQNLLARARFTTLIRQLNAWAVKMRKPWLPVLWNAIKGFLVGSGPSLDAERDMRLAVWLADGFINRNRLALCGYPSRINFFGSLPSFQDHMRELNQLRRFLAWWGLNPKWVRDVRLPFLDRDLLEFTYAIPREQLVRVGVRRSLMKRALIGIVPNELLNRKRRQPVQQTTMAKPKNNNSPEWPNLMDTGQIASSAVGIMDQDRFLSTLQNNRKEAPSYLLKRSLILESWLRHLSMHGVLRAPISTTNTVFPLDNGVKFDSMSRKRSPSET
jgi:asparagine synthase (glutamine-hydrolysing)